MTSQWVARQIEYEAKRRTEPQKELGSRREFGFGGKGDMVRTSPDVAM